MQNNLSFLLFLHTELQTVPTILSKKPCYYVFIARF